MDLGNLIGFTYYSSMHTRDASGISRGLEAKSCEEHHTVVRYKDKEIRVNL